MEYNTSVRPVHKITNFVLNLLLFCYSPGFITDFCKNLKVALIEITPGEYVLPFLFAIAVSLTVVLHPQIYTWLNPYLLNFHFISQRSSYLKL